MPELVAWIDRVAAGTATPTKLSWWTTVRPTIRGASSSLKAVSGGAGHRVRPQLRQIRSLVLRFSRLREVVITMDADLQDSPDEIPNCAG